MSLFQRLRVLQCYINEYDALHAADFCEKENVVPIASRTRISRFWSYVHTRSKQAQTEGQPPHLINFCLTIRILHDLRSIIRSVYQMNKVQKLMSEENLRICQFGVNNNVFWSWHIVERFWYQFPIYANWHVPSWVQSACSETRKVASCADNFLCAESLLIWRPIDIFCH